MKLPFMPCCSLDGRSRHLRFRRCLYLGGYLGDWALFPWSAWCPCPRPKAPRSWALGGAGGRPEAFGRWMGDGEAEIALVLPETPTSLTLALSVAAFGGEVLDLVLSHNGQQIGRHQTRINHPFLADVSALPRGRELRLSLALPGAILGCPATRDGASDPRSLGLMLQSVRLDPDSTAPFGSSIALGGGADRRPGRQQFLRRAWSQYRPLHSVRAGSRMDRGRGAGLHR